MTPHWQGRFLSVPPLSCFRNTELIFLLPRTPVKQKERYPEELLFLPQIARNRLRDSTKSVFRK